VLNGLGKLPPARSVCHCRGDAREAEALATATHAAKLDAAPGWGVAFDRALVTRAPDPSVGGDGV